MQLGQRKVLRLMALLLTVGLVGAACGNDDDEGAEGGETTEEANTKPIVLAGLEGEAAEGGPDFTKGMQIAVDQINAAGGVKNRKIELKLSKTGGTPEGAATVTPAVHTSTMAICTWCTQEMLTASSCSVEVLHHSGVACALPRYGDEMRSGRWPRAVRRCGDCAVVPGGFHHLGCDVAECPSCDGQLLSCGCRYDEDGPPDEDEADELSPEDAGRVSIDCGE